MEKKEKEEAVKFLLGLLALNGCSAPGRNPGFQAAAKQMTVSKDDLGRWFAEWKADGRKGDAVGGIRPFCLALAAFLQEAEAVESAVALLKRQAGRLGFPAAGLDRAFAERAALLDEESVVKRAARLESLLAAAPGAAPAAAPGAAVKAVPRGVAAPVPAPAAAEAPIFIANQVTYEGLDELQRLLLAHELGFHVAIDGPPGVGKTQSVIEASRILGTHLYTKTCSSRTTESHIIAFPVLAQRDGATVTEYVDGPLCRAMREGAVFYGDEFNLLKEDVQKRMNSAFDERRSVDRPDGADVKAAPGFWAVISYNPTRNITSRDLEDSVADRFLHMHFCRWDSDFKAYVSLNRSQRTRRSALRTENDFGIRLGWRGVSRGLQFYLGEAKGKEVVWRDFFTGGPVRGEPEHRYLVHDDASMFRKDPDSVRRVLADFERQAYSRIELTRVIARYADLLHSLATTGESPLLAKIGLGNIKEKEDLELLQLHAGSARIEIAAMTHYQYLTGRGWNRYLAQAYAARLVIDQLCYGQYRDRKLRDSTVYELCTSIARNFRLLADNAQYNTRLVAEALLPR